MQTNTKDQFTSGGKPIQTAEMHTKPKILVHTLKKNVQVVHIRPTINFSKIELSNRSSKESKRSFVPESTSKWDQAPTPLLDSKIQTHPSSLFPQIPHPHPHPHPKVSSPPMMFTSTSTTTTSWPELLKGVLAESYRVVSAHSRHFLALSVLFLLPLSSLLISSPSLFLLLTSHFSPSSSSSTPPQSLLRLSSSSSFHPHFLSILLIALLLLLVSLLLLLSAFSSLARSVRSGFFGRPVRLLPALSSVPSSLRRLLLTLLPISTPLLLLSSPLLLALRFLPRSPFLLIFPLSFLSSLPLLYLAVSWSLSLPVAALESSSGLRPLRRSAGLIRGMRPVAVFLYLLFAPWIGLVLWQCGLGEVRAFAGWREAVPVVARTVFGSALTAVLMLDWMVSSVVLYLYCKAVHGELAAEIAEEFAWEYVCLPFDEEKVPHVVSVVRQ